MTLSPANPRDVVMIAEAWIGTPYLHQASVMGVGCDCLGLARGIFRALHGSEPAAVPPYSRDWGEVGAREVLQAACRNFLIEGRLAEAQAGWLVLFRMARGAPTKHCGVLYGAATLGLIHARENTGVILETYSTTWRRRAVAAFQFPG